jgi:hypothetical protein
MYEEISMTRSLLGICAAAVTALTVACSGGDAQSSERVALAGPPADTLVVYKSPTCGCCSKWVDHVEQNGFAVVAHDISDQELAALKPQLGVKAAHASCHTATVRGYTIEGHVPADLIARLIRESPRGVKGLAVPGMPLGSPGMESLIRQEYDVLSFDEHGNEQVYATR